MKTFGDMIVDKLRLKVKTMSIEELKKKYETLEAPIDGSKKDIEIKTKLQKVFLDELKEREGE